MRVNVPVGPDPRKFHYIPVDALEIDPGEQRDINKTRQSKIEKIAAAWDWNRCEAVTARMTGAGTLKVIEGQGRVLALRSRDPKAEIPCFILEIDQTEAAGVASGIAKSRTGHTRFDLWKLAVRRGDEFEIAAEKAVEKRMIRIGQTPSTNVIGAVGVVARIIHGHGHTPEQGAEVLGQVIDILIAAYPSDVTRNSSLRWNASMLRAVHTIVVEVPVEEGGFFDTARFVKTLSARPAEQWINMGKDSGPTGDNVVVRTMVVEYNKRLQHGRLVWG